MEWVYNTWLADSKELGLKPNLYDCDGDGEKYTDPAGGCSINSLKKMETQGGEPRSTFDFGTHNKDCLR
jgi:hypothetical protein